MNKMSVSSWNFCFLCSSQLPSQRKRSSFPERQLNGEHKVLLKYILNHHIDDGANDTDDDGVEVILASIANLKLDATCISFPTTIREQFNVLFCEGCDNYAEIVTNLYKQIRSIEIELNKTLSAVKRSVISNSLLFGNNLEVRKHYWKVKEWMKKQEQSGERGSCERGRQFFKVLQKFQDFVYENEDQKPYKHFLDFDGSLETGTGPQTTNSNKTDEFENPSHNYEDELESGDTSIIIKPAVVKVERSPPPPSPVSASVSRPDQGNQSEISSVIQDARPRRNTKTTSMKSRKRSNEPIDEESDSTLEPKQIAKKRRTNLKNTLSPVKPAFSAAQKLARQRHRQSVISSKKTTIEVVTSALSQKKKKIYICSECSYKTKLQYQMEYHLRSHETSDKPFSCPDCADAKFTQKQYFDLHLQLHSGMFKLKCDVCEEHITPINMKTHLSSHSNTIYDCPCCSQSFATFVALALHIRHHPGVIIPCGLCSSGETSVPTTSRSQLLAHLYEVHNYTQLLLTCDIPSCSKTFFDPARKYVHVSSHKRRFSCDKCSKTFGQARLLQQHKCSTSLNRESGFLYRCSTCPKSFRGAATLTKHMEVDHKVTDWFCEKCGPDKKFNTGRGYQKHILGFHRGDEGGKQFKCDQCPRVFALNHRLTEHLKLHTGQKDFACEHCGFSTHTKDLLKTHLKIHERNRDNPYACPFCPMTFELRNIFEPHVRTHWDERPYKCDLCIKSFREKRDLTSHKRCHSGTRREANKKRKEKKLAEGQVSKPKIGIV